MSTLYPQDNLRQVTKKPEKYPLEWASKFPVQKKKYLEYFKNFLRVLMVENFPLDIES